MIAVLSSLTVFLFFVSCYIWHLYNKELGNKHLINIHISDKLILLPKKEKVYYINGKEEIKSMNSSIIKEVTFNPCTSKEWAGKIEIDVGTIKRQTLNMDYQEIQDYIDENDIPDATIISRGRSSMHRKRDYEIDFHGRLRHLKYNGLFSSKKEAKEYLAKKKEKEAHQEINEALKAYEYKLNKVNKML